MSEDPPTQSSLAAWVEARNKQYPWLKPWLSLVIWGVIFGLVWQLFSILPQDELSDWNRFYTQPDGLRFYPPWSAWFFGLFNWEGGKTWFTALGWVIVAFYTWKISHNTIAVAMAGFNFPILVSLSHGPADAFLILGLALLPWGIPLVLIKPQVVIWALFARFRWLWMAAVFGLLTFLVWGLWPITQLGVAQDAGSLVSVHNISAWRLGWPFGAAALGMMLYTLRFDRDPDRLMCAGALLFPYMMVNHYIPLLPALGRVRTWQRYILWGFLWLPIVLMGFSEHWRSAAMLYPFVLWVFLHKPERPSAWGVSMGLSWLEPLEKPMVEMGKGWYTRLFNPKEQV